MITIQEYAVERGCSRQAVYNAIKKYNLETVQGISNGKAAQYLTDETRAKLNEVIRATSTEVSNLNNTMSLAIATRENELNKEIIKAKEETNEELKHTRELMLARVTDSMQGLNETLASMRAEYKEHLATKNKKINELTQILNEKQQEITQLQQELAAAQARIKQLEEHPFKEWNTRRKELKNGKSAESN